MVKLGKETKVYSVGRKKFKTKKAALAFAKKTGAEKIKIETFETRFVPKKDIFGRLKVKTRR